jgi:hypothetical protein
LEVKKDAYPKKPIPIGFFGVLRDAFFDVGWEMHFDVFGAKGESNLFCGGIWLFEAVIDKIIIAVFIAYLRPPFIKIIQQMLCI